MNRFTHRPLSAGHGPAIGRSHGRVAALRQTLLASALGALAAAPAQAGTVKFDNGLEVTYSLSASYAVGVRMKDPDRSLIGPGDAGQSETDVQPGPNSGLAGAGTASTVLNFKKGDIFTKYVTLLGDLNIKKGDTGMLIRGKAFNDLRLSSETVEFGAASNDYRKNQKLDDSMFDTNLSKFKGAEVLDAYVYSTLDLTDEMPMTIRMGQHVVNFGESLFLPNVNQYQVLDVAALAKPGVQLKEAFIPVPQFSMNLGLGNGYSLDAFYQFEHRKAILDGCGTYFSRSTVLNCRNDAVYVSPPTGTSEANWNGENLSGRNYRFDKDPDVVDNSTPQFGLSLRKYVEAVDTEFGLYAVQWVNKLPYLSVRKRADNDPNRNQQPAGSAFGVNDISLLPFLPPVDVNGVGSEPFSAYYDYSRVVRTLGLSGTTLVGATSVSAELSYSLGFPVQVNTFDALNALLYSTGPAAPLIPGSEGGDIAGGFKKNKTQLNISGIRLFPRVLGATQMTVIAEAAFQYYSGIGDPFTELRYGRAFEFGPAQHAAYGGDCPVGRTNVEYCTLGGYVTPFSWGYRVRAELEYGNLIPNTVLRPRIFLSQDVEGVSGDNLLNEGRYAVSPALRFEYDRNYFLDASYTFFNPNARFDPFKDRDFVGVVVGANF